MSKREWVPRAGDEVEVKVRNEAGFESKIASYEKGKQYACLSIGGIYSLKWLTPITCLCLRCKAEYVSGRGHSCWSKPVQRPAKKAVRKWDRDGDFVRLNGELDFTCAGPASAKRAVRILNALERKLERVSHGKG